MHQPKMDELKMDSFALRAPDGGSRIPRESKEDGEAAATAEALLSILLFPHWEEAQKCLTPDPSHGTQETCWAARKRIAKEWLLHSHR